MNSVIINKEFNKIIFDNVIKKHWYKIFLVSGIFLLSAFIYVRYSKQIFETSATLQLIEENKVKDVLGNQSIVQPSNDISKEVELLRSEIFFSKALTNLSFNTSVFSEGKLMTKNLFGFIPFSIVVQTLNDSSLCDTRINIQIENTNSLQLSYQHNGKKYVVTGQINQLIKSDHFLIEFRTTATKEMKEVIKNNTVYFKFNDQKILVNEMRPFLIVEQLDPNAKTIKISYRDNNPKICFLIVQKLTDLYLNFDKTDKLTKSNKTISFIDQQLDSLSRILKISRDSLSNFQRRERIPDPDRIESQLSTNINDLTNRLFEINEEIATLITVNNNINLEPNRIDIYRLIPEMIGKKSFEGTLLRQIEDLNQLLEIQEDLLRDVTKDNKQNKVMNERIKGRIISIKRSISTIDKRLKNDKSMVEKKIEEIETKYFDLPEKKMEFERLKYLEGLNNRYFSLFTEKKIEFELSNAGYSISNRILSPPTFPKKAISPNIGLIYLIFLFLGFIFSIGWIVFKYLTYNEITTVQDLESLLPEKANILGSVPLYSKKLKFSEIVVNESSKSRLAEAIRNIRANMSFINKESKLIAVSSSVSGEGKTFVILNLAGLIAAGGKKTLVIDLDLRKPKIHHGFKVSNELGMSNYISGLATFEEVVRHASIANLDFITAGLIPPNPSELIQSENFKNILASLKERYDVILIDNPPVGIVSDGIHLLAQADIPIYVFKANYSKRVFAQRVDELFKVQKLKSLNVILNGVEAKQSIYGYGYQYGYTYSGYYSDEESGFFLFKWFRKIKSKWKK